VNNESIESITTTAGLAGFIVLFSLAIACWFLFRGMNKRLRNIRLREEREAAERERRRTQGLDSDDPDAGESPGSADR
jgi:hypothetical protein